MAANQWRDSSSAFDPFYSSSSTFKLQVGEPLPQSPWEHMVPNRETTNNHKAFSDECFRHIPDRCIQLRTVLRFLLATPWWANNQSPPAQNNLVQLISEARDSQNPKKRLYRCLFCDTEFNSTSSAMQCVMVTSTLLHNDLCSDF